MLKRKDKRRYISVMHPGQAAEALDALARRLSELFGHVAAERASVRLVRSGGSLMIVRCRLDSLDSVLAAIALTDPPMVTLDMSASLKRMKRRQQE